MPKNIHSVLWNCLFFGEFAEIQGLLFFFYEQFMHIY